MIALTVDNTTGRNSETYLRTRPKDLRPCAACHEGEPGTAINERPMYDGIDMTGVTTQNPAMDWAFADRIRKFWKGKFIIKGIDTREDARLCVEHGIDGILVSNHGGRSTETLRATIEALPEVVGRSERPHSGVRRWRHSPRHRCLQGPGAGRQGRGDRASHSCGDWERSARPASIACSKSCRAN